MLVNMSDHCSSSKTRYNRNRLKRLAKEKGVRGQVRLPGKILKVSRTEKFENVYFGDEVNKKRH